MKNNALYVFIQNILFILMCPILIKQFLKTNLILPVLVYVIGGVKIHVNIHACKSTMHLCLCLSVCFSLYTPLSLSRFISLHPSLSLSLVLSLYIPPSLSASPTSPLPSHSQFIFRYTDQTSQMILLTHYGIQCDQGVGHARFYKMQPFFHPLSPLFYIRYRFLWGLLSLPRRGV